jgi:hypothetical protein
MLACAAATPTLTICLSISIKVMHHHRRPESYTITRGLPPAAEQRSAASAFNVHLGTKRAWILRGCMLGGCWASALISGSRLLKDRGCPKM